MSLLNIMYMTAAFWITGAGVFMIGVGVAIMWQITVEGGMP